MRPKTNSRYIIILFLPPRVTSRHQPANIGMISSVKVRYRVKMLDILLSLFDVPGGYKSANTIACVLQPSGMKGLDYLWWKGYYLRCDEDSTAVMGREPQICLLIYNPTLLAKGGYSSCIVEC